MYRIPSSVISSVVIRTSHIAYRPLGAGLLTGKYGVEKRPERGRLVEDKRYTDRGETLLPMWT